MILILSIQHRICFALDIKSIEFVRLKYEFFCLKIGNAVEDDVETARHYSTVLLVSDHCVRFAAARYAVSEEQAVFPIYQIFDQGKGDGVENVLLVGFIGKNSCERCLDFLSQVAKIDRRLWRCNRQHCIGYNFYARDVIVQLHWAQSTVHLDRFFCRAVVVAVWVPRPVQYWLSTRNWFHASETVSKIGEKLFKNVFKIIASIEIYCNVKNGEFCQLSLNRYFKVSL